jgi:basic membrane protein A
VDVAVYKAFQDARQGTWQPGQLVLGLAENGVDYSYDEHNRTVLTPAMKQRLDQARADIISGKLKVSEYRAP